MAMPSYDANTSKMFHGAGCGGGGGAGAEGSCGGSLLPSELLALPSPPGAALPNINTKQWKQHDAQPNPQP